jgi:V8-like Glu-specific endopeptidase
MIANRRLFLVTLFYLSIFFSFVSDAMENENDLEGILKATLKTNKIDHVGYGKYLIDSESFSEIFPPCIIGKNKINYPLWSVAQVLDETQTDAIGTAIAIEETKNKNILFMTAKHVVDDRIVTFRFGAQIENSLGLPDSQYTDLICKEIKCFIHPTLDFALVEAEVKQNRTNMQFPISKYNTNHSLDETNQYNIYHYPWGIEGQRLNSGKIETKNINYLSNPYFVHYIDTLPGSSGAPIFYKDEVIGIHIGRGKHFAKTKIGIDYQDIEDHSIIFSNSNKYNNAVEFNRFIPLSQVKFKDLKELIR